MCAKFTVRPFAVFFVDTKNVWGGVLIGLGLFIGLCGRRFQKLTNFLLSSMITAFAMFLVFSSTFMTGEKGWVIIVTSVGTCFAAFIVGAFSVYFMRFGGAVIGGIAGFLLGILLNNAWIYIYGQVIAAYSVCGFLAVAFFVFALLEHKFNTTVIFGNSFIAAYMIIRGIAVYVGYWHNEITLLGEMRRKNEIAAINPLFYTYLGSVLVLWLLLIPI